MTDFYKKVEEFCNSLHALNPDYTFKFDEKRYRHKNEIRIYHIPRVKGVGSQIIYDKSFGFEESE